jgi:hypothetical protein
MADARAEQIIAAIKTLLTGLATTGQNVQRGQIYEHEKAKLPALSITMGEDSPVSEQQTGLVDWELTVSIQSVAEIIDAYTATESALDTLLNLIRKEVHAAIMADHTLGLDFVIDISPGPANEPILSGAGSVPTGSQSIDFVVWYRTSRDDISAG